MQERDDLQKLSEKLLSLSRADEAEVLLSQEDVTHLRFARNAPSTSGTYTNRSIGVRSTFGSRSGSATVNQWDEASLLNVVRRSEELARLAPDDPEFVPALGAQRYADVDAWDTPTAEKGAEFMAEGVARCIRDASDSPGRSLVAAGFTTSSSGVQSIANSKGLFGYHASTGAYAAETVRTADGSASGWASQASHRIEDIDYAAMSRQAVSKALASAQPRLRSLPPGRYVTILEPACVANLAQRMVGRMSARLADEGRSYFSSPDGGNRTGEKLFPDDLDISSDPGDAAAPAMPWGSDGLPQRPRPWIEGGRVAGLYYDRYWASQSGVEPAPYPSNILMRGRAIEGGTVDDLVRSTERGVLVTSFWYIRDVDPRTLLLTGLTRDGVFYVEDGRISHPLSNYRWNDSPISAFKSIQAVSDPVRIPPRPSRISTVVVPAIKTEFQLSSISEAI